MVKHDEIKANIERLKGKVVFDCHNIINIEGICHIYMKNTNITWMNKEEPIAILSDGSVLTHKKSSFYVIENGNRKKIGSIERKPKEKLIESYRLLYRMFRRGVRCSCVTVSDEVFFFCDRELYTYSSGKGIKRIFTLEETQSVPLNIVIPYDEHYSVIWGEYFDNAERKAVNIVGITKSGTYTVLYTFTAGSIRHVHNIVKDIHGGYYIFTGDNDEKAGIYHSDADFKSVVPILIGKQYARVVQGISTEDGLLYATDSVSEENKIILLTIDENNTPIICVKACINGSCIYGGKYGNGFLFSTTVESGEDSKNKFFSFLSRKRGAGILSDNVDLIYVDEEYNNKVLFSWKKDMFPYKLFQYGVIHLAAGEYNRTVCICPMGVKKYDGKMGMLKI